MSPTTTPTNACHLRLGGQSPLGHFRGLAKPLQGPLVALDVDFALPFERRAEKAAHTEVQRRHEFFGLMLAGGFATPWHSCIHAAKLT
eukprot:scaffold685_cov281-Pinguiococcus_pyrenoidosus.AAC.14